MMRLLKIAAFAAPVVLAACVTPEPVLQTVSVPESIRAAANESLAAAAGRVNYTADYYFFTRK